MEKKGRGYLESTAPLFLCLVLICLPSAVPASENPCLDQLLERASREKLHDDPYWHTLLHYVRKASGADNLSGQRAISLIDDPEFFLSREGKHDPEKELQAAISSFFNKHDERNHLACKYIARYTWLKEKLGLDEAKIDLPRCTRFEKLIENISPESVSLSFPTAHMNSPASMFGHTLLVIETANKSRMLAYAVNYAAVTTETFGPAFAVKGIFGLYRGFYSVLPYYAKIQEYNDFDRRDMWEYALNLNQEEVKRLVMHLYELENIYSDYYFFDENCSYNILYLLETARPGLSLVEQCSWWVIPVDTIRIVQANGLVSQTRYRPSRTKKIMDMASSLPEKEQKRSVLIAAGALDPKSVAETGSREHRIKLLDLSAEYLQYKYTKKDVSKADYLDRFMKILNLRSQLGQAGEEEPRAAIPARPDQGHGSNRVALGVGLREGDFFQEIKVRPAYHDLLDDDRGYTEGAQLIFLEPALRYYSGDGRLELSQFNILDIVSISPRDDFFQPVSWKIKTGLFRKTMGNGEDDLVFQVNPGGGFAWKNEMFGTAYVFFESDLNVGPDLDKNYAVGLGGSLGLIRNLSENWKAHLYARDIYYGLGDTHNSLEIGLGQNYSFEKDKSVLLDVSFVDQHDISRSWVKLYLNLYF